MKWFNAQQLDIGKPIGSRYLLSSGQDSSGQDYKIYARNFEKGLILIRPASSYLNSDYSDQTKISVTLPRQYTPVMADGSSGMPSATFTLRNSEALILH